jgi:hypothetical protein
LKASHALKRLWLVPASAHIVPSTFSKEEGGTCQRKPEECDIELMETLNRGDLEASVAPYDPNAAFVPEPAGPVLSGRAAIREAIRGYLELRLADDQRNPGTAQ